MTKQKLDFFLFNHLKRKKKYRENRQYTNVDIHEITKEKQFCFMELMIDHKELN